jgi:hypothetical protein
MRLFLAPFCAAAIAVLVGYPSPALADEHKFKVKNEGGHQVDHLYISPISMSRWGPDQLGAHEVLPPGHRIAFVIDTDCEMDVRVVYHDGTVHVDKDVDTCKYNLVLHY